MVCVLSENRCPGNLNRSFLQRRRRWGWTTRAGSKNSWLLPSPVLPPIHALASHPAEWAKQGRGQPPFFFPLSDFSNGCTIFNSCKKASQSMSREAVGRWCQQGTLRTGGAGPTCVWLSKAFSCHRAGCINPARAWLLLAWGLLAGDSLALTSCQGPPQKGTQKLVSEHQASFGSQC